ncbi:MAG TPA: AAA family ATPase, partial [Planctomycetota bacterium]|nr:AAA family ATPase [Planctomycetota bacterium]
KKYFEKDAALARRFQLVKLDEPNEAVTVTMLRGLRDRYEQAHGVLIRDDALTACAQLGSRYIAGRQHPDKGIDLMDTSAARVKVALTTKPPELQDLERSIQTIERELAAYKRDQSTGQDGLEDMISQREKSIAGLKDKAASLTERWQKEKAAAEKVLNIRRKMFEATGQTLGGQKPKAEAPPSSKKETKLKVKDEPKKETKIKSKADVGALKKDLDAALADLKKLQGKDPLIQIEVTPDIVAKVISDWTGIPIGKMVQDEAASLLEFEKQMTQRVKGQDHVMKILGTGIRASKAGLKDPKTPIGVFLLVGPSGTGKTETALGVADLMFGGERMMTTINMSEFQEKHTVSRLIGSPPGYVGYGEGGVLTEGVRQKPYSVVLLDEVEKADPDVMNLFYQVFDKGMLSDGEGREVDFKDTIIFMTSNLASDMIQQAVPVDGSEKPPLDDLIATIRPVLSKHFKPALLARMSIVPFFPIDVNAMKDIVILKLNKIKQRMAENHKMLMVVDDKVIDNIAARCTEVETGARNIDHILRGTLLPKISSEILSQMTQGPLPEKLTVGMDDKGEFTFAFGKK